MGYLITEVANGVAITMVDEETNEVFNIGKTIEKIYIYILYKNDFPIYIGRTKNIKTRIIQHKYIRDFDFYKIAFTCYSDFEATVTEKNCITIFNELYETLQNKNCIGKFGNNIKGE